MSEEQNEVLEQQRHLLERRMYRLDPAPPKLPAQEYIVRYLTEKEDKYLAFSTMIGDNFCFHTFRVEY